jgi:hypothetical protein
MISKKEVLENLEEVKKYVEEIENKKEEKVIGIAIKNRWTGEIVFQSTKTTYKEAIEEKGDANLTGADLTDANLTDANLTGADLTDANLTGADLTGCLFYMGCLNRNFEALCKAIKTIKHDNGTFDELSK